MCGLFCILDWEEAFSYRSQAEEAVKTGLRTMAYRGTQDPNHFIVGRTILGHVRLPIIGTEPEWDQPLSRHEIATAFVGEIFNYKQLDPTAWSDTQVLIDTYYNFGVGGFHQFDGFWSCVLVPGFGNPPVVITDYLSQKPLYYDEETTIVSSEIDAILAVISREGNRSLDEVYLSNVLKWGYDPTGRTPYTGIRQLQAGSKFTHSPGRGLKQTPYWDWDRVKTGPSLKGALIQATENRLVGEEEVALLLSGGLDSTLVFKILTDVLHENVKVFHVDNDEDQFVNMALKGYPSEVLVCPPASLPDALAAHQVPVDLGSMLPQFAMAKAIQEQGFKVVMSGDGADELFGGYRRAMDYDSQFSDVFCELPYYHHPRLDRLMMRHTIELRSPYMAPGVIKYALELPHEYRTEKQALKEISRGLVPDAIIDRPKHPLKTLAVRDGGVKYRKQLVRLFREMNDG